MAAAEGLADGAFERAFAFIGAGGHHAGRDYFGGYCCYNDVVIAIAHLRATRGIRRFAILDTDAHHGDGTRDLTARDPEVLHVCICGASSISPDGTKVDVPLPEALRQGTADPDALYLKTAEAAFAERAAAFRPDLTVWYFGFDGHRGDYGDMGLSAKCFLGLADLMTRVADQASGGKLLTVLGGGSRTDLATALIPPIIERLMRRPAEA